MNIVDCNMCNASQYGGYADLDNSIENCLLFDTKLETRDDDSSIPCDKCNGKFFKEDEL